MCRLILTRNRDSELNEATEEYEDQVVVHKFQGDLRQIINERRRIYGATAGQKLQEMVVDKTSNIVSMAAPGLNAGHIFEQPKIAAILAVKDRSKPHFDVPASTVLARLHNNVVVEKCLLFPTIHSVHGQHLATAVSNLETIVPLNFTFDRTLAMSASTHTVTDTVPLVTNVVVQDSKELGQFASIGQTTMQQASTSGKQFEGQELKDAAALFHVPAGVVKGPGPGQQFDKAGQVLSSTTGAAPAVIKNKLPGDIPAIRALATIYKAVGKAIDQATTGVKANTVDVVGKEHVGVLELEDATKIGYKVVNLEGTGAGNKEAATTFETGAHKIHQVTLMMVCKQLHCKLVSRL
ncbi:uncharacterized protein [Nicotiana tomentosiformis]|uniref:uncharacterized protein isoform X1 n=1 Tax=Nicotiana tomentosiformis TaxID=4098 RepID=UPI00051C39E5|nr:uncharacterized protein LOC104106538 isoform X1 [Nicotiana tomentosiformis]